MILKMHYNDLIELQQSLLAAYLYFMLIGDVEAAEVYGDQFDKLYHYDNSHENKLKTTNTHTL